MDYPATKVNTAPAESREIPCAVDRLAKVEERLRELLQTYQVTLAGVTTPLLKHPSSKDSDAYKTKLGERIHTICNSFEETIDNLHNLARNCEL